MMERKSRILEVRSIRNKMNCGQLHINQFYTMNNKPLLSYLMLIFAHFLFGCGGSVKEENKNNASASSVSLHAGNEKYVTIDTKESIVAWKGYNLNGLNSQTGYVHISKGELMIENERVTGGIIELYI